ncbi:hypothetical protein [Agromyces tropicus]
MRPTAMWDDDSIYRLRRMIILGVVGVPIVLVAVLILGMALTRG